MPRQSDLLWSINLRHRIADTTRALFAHTPYPLDHTLEFPGDPGLFGPGSITWTVVGDVSSFVGGIRALLVQAAHPEVVAGVADHSLYKRDPLGRLSRTSAYVTATTFGAMPEIEKALHAVRVAHRRVEGTSHRGVPYNADDPDLSSWVHNALAESFLLAYQAYGPRRLTRQEEDAYAVEQARLGELVGAAFLPRTAAEMSAWLATYPALAPSPGMRDAVDFLRRPPLNPPTLLGYLVLFKAAVATIPAHTLGVLGLRPRPGAAAVGRVAVAFLRWALGESPSKVLAEQRIG
jgi:uncharacterized protein (DUF2236 family)